ncbi:MAG: translation initiation factor IF-2, partial [Candidatus Omnitrophica bacterium]|nr:translation initiation factor IF-2 [Candidatus Omnitrophota bacterium]
KLAPRAPVVTFMGHVDHGKTSLLDAIREAKVAEKEAGGITQHIGAYEVLLEKGHVTFLDTPGHEAFSALRSRGANVTDIVVLVVAADDGVMPQTVEAIDHAKAADVPIVVAINKVDKPEANPQKVKQQLSQHGLIGEDWGGKTIMVPVSAKSRQGIDGLLEMLLLEAELLELRADPTAPAQGTVIEAKQTKDRGPVVTLLIQQGTLRIGETIVIGHHVGRVRAMVDDRGHRIKEAGPAKPVEVLGLPEVPQAGDRFLILADEKVARQLAEQRAERRDQQAILHPKRITLEELHQRIAEGKLKELRLILKADVQGSLEAIVQSLEKLDIEKEEVQFKILHMGVGDINESDIILAAASDAIVVGFHVGIEPKVQVLAATEGVDLHIYQIIYELVGAIKAAIEGLLEPTIEETFIGRAEVRKLFQVAKSGVVAGCLVTKGTIRRDCAIRVVRGRERIAETRIANLKRVKDDAREVQEGVECGILLEGSATPQVGDLIEAWELTKVARKLA